VQPFVKAAAMRGLSSAQLTTVLRETYGQAYRRTDLLADLRYYGDVERKSDAFRSVRKDLLPSDRLFSAGHIRHTAANYRIVGEITFRDRSGRTVTEFATTLYRDRRTREDVEHDLADVAADYPTRRELERVGVRVVELYRRV
jgi:hypothetical protein